MELHGGHTRKWPSSMHNACAVCAACAPHVHGHLGGLAGWQMGGSCADHILCHAMQAEDTANAKFALHSEEEKSMLQQLEAMKGTVTIFAYNDLRLQLFRQLSDWNKHIEEVSICIPWGVVRAHDTVSVLETPTVPTTSLPSKWSDYQ